MKILVFGGNGFIGQAVVNAFSKQDDVYSASRNKPTAGDTFNINLLNKNSISELLTKLKPDVIINCAGIVENSPNAKMNVEFTRNILDAVIKVRLRPKSIIICGSSAEYGEVEPDNLPVNEAVRLNAANDYAMSKKRESELALEYRHEHSLPVTVARIFNPVGSDMHPKFLIPAIVRQIKAIEGGEKKAIEISRLDSKRDYIDVSDAAEAIKILAVGQPKFEVYNIGSGMGTSNSELVDMAVKYSSLGKKPIIVETFAKPEPVYAVQADISRIKNEFGWEPKQKIEDTVKEVMHATRRR